MNSNNNSDYQMVKEIPTYTQIPISPRNDKDMCELISFICEQNTKYKGQPKWIQY